MKVREHIRFTILDYRKNTDKIVQDMLEMKKELKELRQDRKKQVTQIVT